MSEQQWKETFTETKPLEPYTGKPLHGYSGHEVQVMGQVMVNVEYGNQRRELPLLIVIGQQRPPLFGRDWLHSIQIEWTKVHQIRRGQEADIVNRFPLVFQKGVGTIKGTKQIFDSKKEQNQFLRKAVQLHTHYSHCWKQNWTKCKEMAFWSQWKIVTGRHH